MNKQVLMICMCVSFFVANLVAGTVNISGNYLGGTTTSTTPVVVGDFDGDGNTDAVVSDTTNNGYAVIVYGGTSISGTVNTPLFGDTADGLKATDSGSVNGDAYADLLMTGGRKIYVNYGSSGRDTSVSASSFDLSFTLPAAYYPSDARFFTCQGNVGVAVGVSTYDGAGGTDTGAILIYYDIKTDQTLDKTIEGVSSGDAFGSYVSVGDFNKDGNYEYGSKGGSYGYLIDGTYSTSDSTAATFLRKVALPDSLAGRVSLGDLSGDGYSEMILHHSSYNSNVGVVYGIFGSATTNTNAIDFSSCDFYLNGNGAYSFGSSVRIYDVNKDNVNDISARSSENGGTFSIVSGSLLTNGANLTIGTVAEVVTAVGDGGDGGSHAFGDFNADGKIDLLSGGTNQWAITSLELSSVISPAITFATPSAITYGTSLSATQMNASSTVAGSFSYNVTSGTNLGAGSHVITATFTPTDTATYSTNTASVTLTVNKKALTITADAKSSSFGEAVPAFTATYSGFAAGETSSVLDTAVTLSSTATSSSAVGSYDIVPSGALDVNYEITFVNGSLTVAKVGQSISVSAPGTKTTSSSAFQLDGVATSGLAVTYSSGDTSVATVSGNTVTVVAAGTAVITVSQAGDSSYSSTSTTVNVVVTAKTVPSITFATPSAITYGTAISSTQLSATSTVAGTFSYNTTSGTVFTPGSNVITATFTPTDTSTYASNEASVTLVVNKAVLTATASSASKVFGAANPSLTVSYSGFVGSDTSAGISTVASATTAATTSSSVGSYATTASGASDSKYTFTYVDGALSVTQTTQAITFASISDMNYNGSATVLAATTTGDGVVSYASSDTSIATISGNTLTMVGGSGNVTITASAASTTNYSAATDVARTFMVYAAPSVSLSASQASTYQKDTTATIVTVSLTGGVGTLVPSVTAVNGTSNYGSMALTSGSAGMYTLTVPTTDAGTVVFSAEVTDSVTGLTGSANLSVEVAANAAPVAVVTFTPSAVISGNSVVANIALTDDKSTFANITSTVTLDGATMGASSDGVSALTGSVTTSAVAGTTYTVVVTATDEHGFVSTTTATVTASEAPVSGGVVSTGDSLVDSIFVDVTPGISQSAGDTIVTSLGASVTKDVALNSSIKNFNSTVSASNPTQSFTSDLIKTEVVLSTDVTAVVTNTGASGNAVKMSGVPVGYTATLATIDKSKYSSVPAGAVGDVISVALMNGSSIVNSGVSLSFTLTGLADSTKTQTLSQLQDDGSWVVRDDITLTASGSDLIATVTGLATTASSKGRQAASTSEASSFVVANDVSSSATAPATSGGGGGGGCLLR